MSNILRIINRGETVFLVEGEGDAIINHKRGTWMAGTNATLLPVRDMANDVVVSTCTLISQEEKEEGYQVQQDKSKMLFQR